MSPDQIDYLIHHLKADGVSFDAGLTDEEVAEVEQAFGFRFPPDLRAFLQTALPVSADFVPWRWGLRNPSIAHHITERLTWPKEELACDARDGTFWDSQWGTRPADRAQWEQVAQQKLADYSQLIPLYSHRYLPELPHEAGNPVFSVVGSDIIHYGYDLFSYFVYEFSLPRPPKNQLPDWPKHIDFWSDFDPPTAGGLFSWMDEDC